MYLYNNPFITSSISSFEEGGDTPPKETIYADHDKAWDYKMIDGVWYTRKKGEESEWLSLEDNEEATTKLNTEYPDAQIVENNTKVEESSNTTEIEEANKKVEEGSDAVFYDEEFRSPEEANLLSGIGDTGLFDLIKAIDTTAGSFKKENYYDSGTKADYSKFSHTNTTNQNLFIDQEALLKGKKTGDVLINEEQAYEKDMQTFLDNRHRNNPDKYAKVKNFEKDLYDKTGSLNYRKGPFGLFKGEGREGDMLENKYSDASHIGFEMDKMGNYGTAFDYLTQDPDGTFNQQDFDNGFKGIPFDPNNPESFNYSEEYLNSSKHNPYINYNQFTTERDYKNLNNNFTEDGRFSKVDPLTYGNKFGFPNTPESPDFKPAGPTPGIDNTNPEEVIAANDKMREQEALRRQQEEQAKMIEEQLRKSQGKRYGGSLPTAETGWEFLDDAITTGSNIYNQGKSIFNTGIKKAVTHAATPFIGSATAGAIGLGGAAYGLLDGNFNLDNTISNANPDKDPDEIKSNVSTMYDGVYGSSNGYNSFYGSMKQDGGSLQTAQTGVETDGMNAFRLNAAAWDLSGRCYNDGCAKRYYDSNHDLSVGLSTGIGKKGQNYMGDASLWGGYSFNPEPGSGSFRGAQEGVAGYLGANIGGRMTMPQEMIESGVGDADFEQFANAVGTIGYKGEWKPSNNYTAYLTGRDKNPLQYGLGAFYKHPLMGDQNSEIGAYANLGNVNFSAGYMPGSGMNYNFGLGIPIRKDGGSLPSFQKKGENTYPVEIIQYPLGYDGAAYPKGMPPGHIESRYLGDLSGTEYEGQKGYVNRWVNSGNQPVRYNAETDYQDGVRTSIRNLNEEEFAHYMKTAQTFTSGDKIDIPFTDLYLPTSIGGADTDYDMVDSNCADGVCSALGMDSEDYTTLGVTTPHQVMDAIIKDKRTQSSTGSKNYGEAVLQAVLNPLDMITESAVESAEFYGELAKDAGNHIVKNSSDFTGGLIDLDQTPSQAWENTKKWWGFEKGGELPEAQFGKGLGNNSSQGMFANRNSGYNPLTNNIDPIDFNTNINVNPIDMNMFANLEKPQEQTEPFFSSADNFYAMNEAVNRSMDSFDAFSADMNKSMQNPSLNFNQVDTNPLNVPDFKIDKDLSNQIQMNQDRMEFKTASEEGRVIGGNIVPTKRETRQNQKDFASQLKKTANDGPFGQGYQGKRKHVRELEKAKELGFDDRNEYLDYVQNEKEEKINRDLTREQLNEDNKDANPSFADKMWNAKNRVLDSKAGQTYSKIGAGAVRIAKPLNRILEASAESKQKSTMMNNAYLSDNMFAANDADLTGSKGDYDVNSGIFRPDDKVVPGTTMTKYGGSFFNDGGEIEIDMNTYKQLVAAGAQIEII